MMDLEEAHRILELRPGAAFRQVSEAREDLLALWNPNRMSDQPRLRAKAARKVEEINQAYDVLMEHLGQDSGRGTTAPDRVPDPAPSVRAIEDSKQGPPGPEHSASLYEEVFSRRKQKKKRGIPVWPIAGGAFLLVLGIVLYPSSSSEDVAGEPVAAAAEELPSEPPVTLPAGAPPRGRARRRHRRSRGRPGRSCGGKASGSQGGGCRTTPGATSSHPGAGASSSPAPGRAVRGEWPTARSEEAECNRPASTRSARR